MPSSSQKRDKTRMSGVVKKGENDDAGKQNRSQHRIPTVTEEEEHEAKKRAALFEKQNQMISVEGSSMIELKELIQTLKRAAIRVEQGTGKKLKWDALVGVKKELHPFALYRGLRHWRSQNVILHEHLALLEPGRRAIRLHDLRWGYTKLRNQLREQGVRVEAMFRLYRRCVMPHARIELTWWRHVHKLLRSCQRAMEKAIHSLNWSGVMHRMPFK